MDMTQNVSKVSKELAVLLNEAQQSILEQQVSCEVRESRTLTSLVLHPCR